MRNFCIFCGNAINGGDCICAAYRNYYGTGSAVNRCAKCGRNLRPGEICDCERKTMTGGAPKGVKINMRPSGGKSGSTPGGGMTGFGKAGDL